jgi:hypothetical protein
MFQLLRKLEKQVLRQCDNCEATTKKNGNNVADTFQARHPGCIVPSNGLEA